MHHDTQSVQQFERRRARDRLAELARTLPDAPPDIDLVSGHAAAERAVARRSVAPSVLAVVLLATLLFLALASA